MARRKREKRAKDTERYYLLPGQGGRAYRRKQKLIIIWSIVAALTFAAIMAVVMYFMDKSDRFSS